LARVITFGISEIYPINFCEVARISYHEVEQIGVAATV